MKKLLYMLILTLMPLLWSCHDSKPGFLQDDEEATTEQGGEGADSGSGSGEEDANPGQRPGFVYDPVQQLDSLGREPSVIGDKTTRYEGKSLKLRYTTPGIMAKRGTGVKSLELIDIDRNARISWNAGRVEADSSLPEAVLEINGTRIVWSEAKLLRVEDGVRWYGVVEPQPDVFAPDQTALLHLIVD